MKLEQFHVTNFRSVEDSGWIEADDVTALIGVNESGKTNLLLPLWKLKPARDGEIEETADYPKVLFGTIRKNPGDYCFIEADFSTGGLAPTIAVKAGITEAEAAIVRVARYFDGSYTVEFPEHKQARTFPAAELIAALEERAAKIEAGVALKAEGDLQAVLAAGLRALIPDVEAAGTLAVHHLQLIKARVDALMPVEPAKTSALVPILKQQFEELDELITTLSAPGPGDRDGVADLVYNAIPSFVYYSNYGNLDSEIYLPHVLDNMRRIEKEGAHKLGSKEAAKARTLKVLFEFVKLEPKEILDLGQDFNDAQRAPTDAEIEKIAERKKVRSILFQSASVLLTKEFREWWRRGDYTFDFEADGDHFRIWVKDDRRPTPVELENRSTGLQWFLSFYLVFLVESRGEHKNCILLLDEPGLSLHPHAQQDLSAFFDSLSKSNQILFTSHSPFLMDPDRLDRARKVYVDTDGTTKATGNLGHAEGKDAQKGAAYAVYSALNLSVSESLLLGCQPVLVEGASDQHYLAAIKTLLVAAGRIKPKRELVFPPCGGTKTARVVAAILVGRDDSLPKVLLDDDVPGRNMADVFRKELYGAHPERILSVATFAGFERAEIEDLFPPKYLADELDRLERGAEERLADVIEDGKPFVGQVEEWAKKQGVTLDPHWKVHLAARVKQRAIARGSDDFKDEALLAKWVKLFESFV